MPLRPGMWNYEWCALLHVVWTSSSTLRGNTTSFFSFSCMQALQLLFCDFISQEIHSQSSHPSTAVFQKARWTKCRWETLYSAHAFIPLDLPFCLLSPLPEVYCSLPAFTPVSIPKGISSGTPHSPSLAIIKYSLPCASLKIGSFLKK